mgnify:CR=1 FL=1
MKATRDAIGDFLPTAGDTNKDIVVLDADLGGATKLRAFGQRHPTRFHQIGIAEANMIGIAGGLSEYGYKVFISSFGSFLTGRYDIIRCSLAYPNRPVVLVGTHVGLAIGKDGVTQMGLEDVSLMRAMPNIKILNPGTYTEATHAIRYLCETDLDSPYYLRLGRQPVEDVFENVTSYKFEFGKGIEVRSGRDISLLTTGCVLPDVVEASKRIEEKTGMSVRVINFHTLKPIDREIILKAASETRVKIFTIEDHTIIGGLGSAVAEVLASKAHGPPLVQIGLNDIFPESGPPADLYEKYGLSANKISERVISERLG